MKQDEATRARLIAQLPTVLQKVTNLKRDVQVAAELMLEKVPAATERKACRLPRAWIKDVGRHSEEWYAGYSQAVHYHQRLIVERACTGRGGYGRVRIVVLRHVFDALYGSDHLNAHILTTDKYLPRYEDSIPFEYPPTHYTYEEYINEWKL